MSARKCHTWTDEENKEFYKFLIENKDSGITPHMLAERYYARKPHGSELEVTTIISRITRLKKKIEDNVDIDGILPEERIEIAKALSNKSTERQKSDQERADVLKFLIEKTETDCKPYVHMEKLFREFRRKFKTDLNLISFRNRFQTVQQNIIFESDYSLERKIKLMFVCRCGISSEHKKKLERDAFVNVENGVIVSYQAKDGSLTLEAKQIKHRKKAKPSVKTGTKKRQVRNSDGESEGDDLDVMSSSRRQPQPKKLRPTLDHSSSPGADCNLPPTPAPAGSLPGTSQRTLPPPPSPLPTQRPGQSPLIADAGVPAARQVSPASPARAVKIEEDVEIISGNLAAQQPSAPRTLFFLHVFRGLVGMIGEKQEEVLKGIDDVVQTYGRIGDMDISIPEVVSSISLSLSNIVRHSTSNPQKNTKYQGLYELLLHWKMMLITLRNQNFNGILEKLEEDIIHLHRNVPKFCPIDKIRTSLQTILDTVAPPAY